jgi:chromosome segregation ATPase
VLIKYFNRSSGRSDVEELNRQIKLLQMEQDAMYEEVADLRRRLHVTQKDNQRLKKILINLGEKMIEEGHS